MSINKDSFKACADRKSVPYTIPGVGEAELRTINAQEYAEVVTLYQARGDATNGDLAEKSKLMVDANCTLIRYAVRAPGGAAIFGPADRDFLASLDAKTFQDMALAATEHCGLGESVEELVGNSEAAQPDKMPTE